MAKHDYTIFGAAKAINEFLEKDEWAKGIIDSTKNLRNRSTNNLSIPDAIWQAHLKNNVKGADLDFKRVAGTALGVSAAGRILSGGGIYRDKDGNANLIGIPFV